jgi:hypothetical protein
MRTSFRALAPEHRVVLVALLDAPPGPVSERELAAAVRRHAAMPLAQSPSELVDRLADHFVRRVPPASVAWVHPSWRDLLVEELSADASDRRHFLERCSLDGALLALSSFGGAAGERQLPLLVVDGDWDALGDRLHALLGMLDDHDQLRLLAALAAEEEAPLPPGRQAELSALAAGILGSLRRAWDAAPEPVGAGLLRAWFTVAARLPETQPPPALARAFLESAPELPLRWTTARDIDDLDAWLRLVEVLHEFAPAELEALGFAARYRDPLAELVEEADRIALGQEGHVAEVQLGLLLRRIGVIVPGLRSARRIGAALAEPEDPTATEWSLLRPLPTAAEANGRHFVERVLRDLQAP